MKPGLPCHIHYRVLVVLAAAFALPSLAQKLAAGMEEVGCSKGLDIPPERGTHYRALRELKDPGTHQHWLLIRDLGRATGPALFVEESQHPACAFFTLGEMNSGSANRVRLRSIPVIHAGDRIILSKHTIVSDAELEATALEEAAIGDSVRVRIKFGGYTTRAIAAAPGRAILGPEASEGRP